MQRGGRPARTPFYIATPYTQRVNTHLSALRPFAPAFGFPAVLLGAWLVAGRLPAVAAASPAFVLVSRGAPSASIVVPPGAAPADRRAAEILQAAVRSMSGATLPVYEKARPGTEREIVIGFADTALPRNVAALAGGLGEDAFVVATAGRNLYVLSGGHKGAIYGVVHLLERYFGCRVFSPTVRVFPRRDTVALPKISDRDRPVNRFRVVNGEFSRDADYRDWHRLDAVEEVFGRGYYVHTFNRLLPWETSLRRASRGTSPG